MAIDLDSENTSADQRTRDAANPVLPERGLETLQVAQDVDCGWGAGSCFATCTGAPPLHTARAPVRTSSATISAPGSRLRVTRLFPAAHYAATLDLQQQVTLIAGREAEMYVLDLPALGDTKHAGEPIGEHG